MYDSKRSAMGKWKRALIAAALTASVILALPVWNIGRAQAAPFDVDTKCELKIERASDSTGQGDIVVDLYKVADARILEGYDAYELFLPEGSAYSSLAEDLAAAQKQTTDKEADKNGNAVYRALAQEAAVIALAVQDTGEKRPDGTVIKEQIQTPTAHKNLSESSTFTDLEPGMYLVIAHGAGMRAEQYTTQVGGEGEKQLATMAYSEEYVYTYLPELIALPGRGSESVGSFNTADNDTPWSYSVTATLKAEQGSRLTSLRVMKRFQVDPDDVITGKNGCVFRIEAELNGENVYSNVVTIPYVGEDAGSVTLSKVIPAGAKVTVTEVYSGVAFTVNGESEETIASAVADGENGTINNNVSFINKSNGSGIGGDIVTNSFTHGEGGWTWNNPRPETPEQ